MLYLYPTHNPVDLTVLDTIVRVPLLDYVKERSKMNAQTYSYMFDLELPLDGGWVPWHCADIPYVFANTSFTPYTQEAGVTERIETEIFDSVMSFARTGDPNNSSILIVAGVHTRSYLYTRDIKKYAC